MAYPTTAQINAAIPADGTPNRALTNAVLRDLVGALPKGDDAKVVSFDDETQQMKAVTFTANHWSDYDLPSVGTYLAAYTPTQERQLDFVPASLEAEPGAAIRGQNGSLKVGIAEDADHAVPKALFDSIIPFKLAASKPATPTSPGTQWEVFIDGEEFFLCVAPNVWRMWTLMSWGE